MKKRLPLPLSTIKEIRILIDKNDSLWIKNPLRNILISIGNYDYSDAIKGLELIKQDQPELMDYKKAIERIKEAQVRYNNI
jgi:hypothetical protein